MIPFVEFPKMARLSREIIITEKLDGTNASIHITEDGEMLYGSRTRWITTAEDNYGFATWAEGNKQELLKLGPGTHFGEWWGGGIQRGYGLTKGEKRFSLFNTYRWRNPEERPSCCLSVPILYEGVFATENIESILKALALHGSYAAPGFMRPEGIVVFHTAANIGFKKTIEKDEVPKSIANKTIA